MQTRAVLNAVISALVLAGCDSRLPVAPEPSIPVPPKSEQRECPVPLDRALEAALSGIPERVFETRQEGWVQFVFDIAADGAATNIRVLNASPKGFFDEAVVGAIEKGRFPGPAKDCYAYMRFKY